MATAEVESLAPTAEALAQRVQEEAYEQRIFEYVAQLPAPLDSNEYQAAAEVLREDMKFKIGKCAKGWQARDVARWKRANALTFGDDWRDQLEEAQAAEIEDGSEDEAGDTAGAQGGDSGGAPVPMDSSPPVQPGAGRLVLARPPRSGGSTT